MVLLYTEGEKVIGKSGLGKAIKHQMIALDEENVLYTTNPHDSYDILHINTYFPKSYLGKKCLFGDNKPPTKGSLIIPPWTCPAKIRSAPHLSYSSK